MASLMEKDTEQTQEFVASLPPDGNSCPLVARQHSEGKGVGLKAESRTVSSLPAEASPEAPVCPSSQRETAAASQKLTSLSSQNKGNTDETGREKNIQLCSQRSELMSGLSYLKYLKLSFLF